MSALVWVLLVLAFWLLFGALARIHASTSECAEHLRRLRELAEGGGGE